MGRKSEKEKIDKEISEDKLKDREPKKHRTKNRRKETMGAIEESIVLGIELTTP